MQTGDHEAAASEKPDQIIPKNGRAGRLPVALPSGRRGTLFRILRKDET